jgi:hypothetical protein
MNGDDRFSLARDCLYARYGTLHTPAFVWARIDIFLNQIGAWLLVPVVAADPWCVHACICSTSWHQRAKTWTE